jgi:RNA polymerase sigma-70 factor (ECF subfamily)
MYPALVRFLYKRVWDVDQAEDLAQEAFVRLLREQPPKPEAWLFTVAGNLAKNHLRGDQRRTNRLTLLAADTVDDVEAGADRAMVRDETAYEVRRVLDALSERDRTLLLLHEDGVPYKELARIVGVSPTSVAPLLARARQRFLRSMGPEGHGDVQTHAS